MSRIVTVHCPSCGQPESGQVEVESFKKRVIPAQGTYEVRFEPATVMHQCPNAMADWTPDSSNGRSGPNIRPMGA